MHDAWLIQLKRWKAKRGNISQITAWNKQQSQFCCFSRLFADLSFGSSGGWKLTIISFCSFCGYLWRRRCCNRVQVRKQITDRRKRFDPFHLSQYMLVFDDVFIGGQQDVELPAAELRHQPTTQSRGALICGETKKRQRSVVKSRKSEHLWCEKRD